MSWINFNNKIMKLRAQQFNNSVAIKPRSLDALADRADSFFWGDKTQIIQSIASISMYPFKIKLSESGLLYALDRNGNDTTYGDVSVGRISYDAPYVTLGSTYIAHKYNNFLDFKDYTTMQVFLPYVGFVDVDINECIAKWLNFRLYIDFYTGQGLYILGVSDNEIKHTNAPYISNVSLDDNMRVIATFECKLATEIPFGVTNMAEQQRNAILNTIKGATSLAASLYTGIPITGTAGQGAVTKKVVTTRRIKDKNAPGGYRMAPYQERKTTTYPHTTKRDVREYVGGVVSDTIHDTANIISSYKPSTSTDRPNSSNLLIGCATNIFVIFHRPVIVEQQPYFYHLKGRPLGEIRRLGELSGYAKISDVHFINEKFGTATQEEIAMLKEALLQGVYL